VRGWFLASPGYVAAPIAHFVSFEVRHFIEMVCRIGPIAGVRHGTFVPMVRMKMIIYVAPEVGGAMEPWAGADENSSYEPLRSIVTVGSASIGRSVVITVRAHRCGSDVDGDLSVHFGCCHR